MRCTRRHVLRSGDEPTHRCPYCNSSVIVPDSLRTPRIAVEAEMSGRGIINGAHDTTGLDGQYEIKGVPVGKRDFLGQIALINAAPAA